MPLSKKLYRLTVAVCLALGLATPPIHATDLSDLYALALEFDPRFQAARYEPQLADEGVREARAGVMPGLSANFQTGRVDQNIKASDSPLFTEGRTDYSSVDTSVVLTQPLYRADALIQLQQARTQTRRADVELAATEQDLIYRVAEAYFEYLGARDGLEFAAAERRAIGRQLEEVQQRFASGLESITVVHETAGRFALAQASEIDAESATESALQAIAEITGSIPTDLESLGETYPLAKPDLDDVDAWVEMGLFRNPQIKAAQLQLQLVEQELRRQRNAGRTPSIDLVGTYGNSDTGGTEFGGGREVATGNVSVRMSIPIYSGGRTSATVRGSELQYRQTLQVVEAERRRVEREVRDAFRGVLSGIRRVEALRQSVFSQEAALSEKEEGRRAGIATNLAVLDARRDLFFARRDLARARYVYILAGLRLKQAAGILVADDLKQVDEYLQ